MRLYIAVIAICLYGSLAFAQGTKDPSTPNTGMVYPINPPQGTSRPTATRNIPPESAAPPLGVRRIYRSGNRDRYRR